MNESITRAAGETTPIRPCTSPPLAVLFWNFSVVFCLSEHRPACVPGRPQLSLSMVSDTQARSTGRSCRLNAWRS